MNKLKYKSITLIIGFLLSGNSIFAQTKQLIVENRGSVGLQDCMLEIPVSQLKLPLGNYVAVMPNKTIVPVEIIRDILGQQIAILPISKIEAGQKQTIKIEVGTHDSYPKRTYAELSHKIGGQFNGNKYEGGFSWVKPNRMTLPGNFTDHAYYIKYEGPGWENDKVAFRFYLDNRNAIDVYGKKTSDIVLSGVGIDGYDNYHNMSFWGMDNLKVGASLGIGSIAIWDGEKAVRVEKRDSTTCIIDADGKLRSQVKTIYHGWDANGIKCNLTSLISLDAGSRASHMQLLADKSIANFATGIIKMKDTELIVKNDATSQWSYIATFGKQSLNNDMQGLVVFAKTKSIEKITEDKLNHLIILKPQNGYAEYYFMPTWQLDKEPVADKETFIKCIDEVLNRLNNPLTLILSQKIKP